VRRNAGARLSGRDRHTPRATGQANSPCGLAAKRGIFAVNDRQHGAFDPKSGAATQDGVAFRYQLKIRVKRHPTEEPTVPSLSKSGSGRGQSASRSAATGLMGRITTVGGMPERNRTRIFETFSDSFLSGITRHGKPQLPCRCAQMGPIRRVIYNHLIAFTA